MIFTTIKVNDEAAVEDGRWEDIQNEAAKHHRSMIKVESCSEAKQLSLQQIRWFKGILLPALAADSGDTIDFWEAMLKFAVLPDDFVPKTVTVNEVEYKYIPSISTLSIKKMNRMIEGSVAKCHEWGFMWVVLPDRELKK